MSLKNWLKITDEGRKHVPAIDFWAFTPNVRDKTQNRHEKLEMGAELRIKIEAPKQDFHLTLGFLLLNKIFVYDDFDDVPDADARSMWSDDDYVDWEHYTENESFEGEGYEDDYYDGDYYDENYYKDPYHNRHAFEQKADNYSRSWNDCQDELCPDSSEDCLHKFEEMQDEYYFHRTDSTGRRARMPHLHPQWECNFGSRFCGWERSKEPCPHVELGTCRVELDCWGWWCPYCGYTKFPNK